MMPGFWDMANVLISAFGIGTGVGFIVGSLIFLLLFSNGCIGWMKNWNVGIKVSPFALIALVGGIFGYLDIMEYATITVPIYRLDYYILGSSMIVISRGLITGLGIGGVVAGILLAKFEEDKG